MSYKNIFPFNLTLIQQILLGLLLGVLLGLFAPEIAKNTELLGKLFVGALKSIAPLVVLILVAHALSRISGETHLVLRPLLTFYIFGMLCASLVGVAASFLFPTTLTLDLQHESFNAPTGIAQVLKTLAMNLVDNPVRALVEANYIGLIFWAVCLGLALRHSGERTQIVLGELSNALVQIVRWIIRLAPFGVFGIVASTIAVTGPKELLNYAHLLLVLIGSMLFVTFIVNPLMVGLYTGRNPYPLLIKCLRESAIFAFFSRSSAANIPVNMELCRKLNLNEQTYSLSIPLGATINMSGAAITISVMTLAAVNTLGISVDIPSALLLCVLATIGATGCSGVPGGSLLLIPMAASLFGISNDVAAQLIGIGFIIGALQDSTETALNSHTDVLFTAAVDPSMKRMA